MIFKNQGGDENGYGQREKESSFTKVEGMVEQPPAGRNNLLRRDSQKKRIEGVPVYSAPLDVVL